MSARKQLTRLVLCWACATCAACGDSGNGNVAAAPAVAGAGGASDEELAGLSNEQVLAIMLAADASALQLAGLASTQTPSPDVMHYAESVIVAQSQRTEELVSFGYRENLIAEESELSLAIARDAESSYGALSVLEPRELDHAYLDAQLANCSQWLDWSEQLLLPAVTIEALRGEVVEFQRLVRTTRVGAQTLLDAE